MKALLAILACTGVASADPMIGVMADAGVPDGGVASLVVRPISAVRLHGGLGYNTISKGVRVGATLTPFRSVVYPTLSLDWGRYPEGDANPLARMLTGDRSIDSTMLENVGYDYANAHLGFAIGRKRASFYLQAGMSRTVATMHDDSSSTSAKATVWSPSARLGFVLYVY
jgi:hypothetical protein